MTVFAAPELDLSSAACAFSGCKDGIAVHVLAPPETAHTPDFAAQCQALFDVDYASVHDVARRLAFLGMAFCVVAVDPARRRVALASGASNALRLYFQFRHGRLHVADRLPAAGSLSAVMDMLERRELVRFLASAWATGPFEATCSAASIRRDWRRVPNGHAVVFDAGSEAGVPVPFDNIFHDLDEGGSIANAVDDLRGALDAHLLRFAALGKVAAEFSGGIDSGLVLARASALLGPGFAGGVTAAYPFFEFGREGRFRDAIIDRAGARVALADPLRMLPFLRVADVPHHDEPSIGSTSWGQFAEALATAHGAGARVLLNGHGGDVMFLAPPDARLRPRAPGALPDPVPRALRAEIAGEAEATVDAINACAPGGAGHWHPAMFESGFLARYANAEHPALRYASGLVGRDVLRAALRLWRLDPDLSARVQKPLAHAAFRDALPDAVWTRPGKVNHVGNVFRGAKLSAGPILALVEDYASVFEIVGIAPAAVVAHARAVVAGRGAADPFFSQALAVLIWVHGNVKSAPSTPLPAA